MLTTVTLHGAMGRRFGRTHQFDIATPGEAISALMATCKGFKEWLNTKKDAPFKVFVGDENVGEGALTNPFAGEPIRIMQVVKGSKTQGVGQIILGVVLIVIGALTSAYGGGFLIKIGVTLVIGGVAQVLFAPPPPGSPAEKAANKPNYNFSGPVNTTAQGQPVAVGYGELVVGGAVINAGILGDMYSGNGWSGGGGGCPVPETPIHISPTETIPAGELKPGMRVWTQHEDTLQWDYYEVMEVTRRVENCYEVRLFDGRCLVASWNHRVLVHLESLDLYRWSEISKLEPNSLLAGATMGEVEYSKPAGFHDVMKIMVRDARTYQTHGFTSHNIKNVYDLYN